MTKQRLGNPSGARGRWFIAPRLALLVGLLAAVGCLQFETTLADRGINQPAYGVPGGEIPVTIYANMPGVALGAEGFVYIRMRNNWGVKNNSMDFTSQSRRLAGEVNYAAGKAGDAEGYWGSGASTYWWGGTTGLIDIETAELVTITGTITIPAGETPGSYVIDYGLGDNQEDPTPPGGDGESFNHAIAIGDLKIALGPKTAPTQTAGTDQSDVVLNQLEIEAGVRAGSYTVTALTFTHTGTAGAMSNVSSARLYRDNNADGKLQLGGDSLLATINSPGATLSFSGFSSVISGGSKGHFVVVYNFSSATVGDTYSLSIVPGGVTATGSPPIVGPAVGSNTTTISNSPSLGVALGDNNPDVTYQIVGAGGQDKTLLQLACNAGLVGGDVDLTSLTLTCTYVGPAANEFEAGDVVDIRLYRDNDGDGELDAATDPQVGNTVTWVPGGQDTTITFNLLDNEYRALQAGSTVNFIAVIDLSGTGTDQEGMMVRLAQAGHVTAEASSDGSPVPATGTFPIGGTRIDILNDVVVNMDAAAVTFSKGGNDPGPTTHTPADTGIVVMQTRIRAPTGRNATISDLVIWNSGTITGSTDVTAVRFYRDVDGDGTVNGGDFEIANGTFNTYNPAPPPATDPNGCRIQISGGYQIPAGEEQTFLFVLDLSGTGSAGETIKLALLDPSDYNDIPSDVTVDNPNAEANLYNGPVLQESSTITLQTSTLTVAAGLQMPPAKGIPANAQKEEVLQLKLTAGALADVTVTEIKFDASGTGHDSTDLQTVHLYNDVNSNGQYDAGTDPSISSGTYSGDNGLITLSGLSEVINAGQTESWLLVYDFKDPGTASGGETFQAQLASNNSITAGAASVSGAPVVSNVLTVNSTGTLTFTAGPANPADGNIAQGQLDVVTLQLQAAANGVEDVEISQIDLTHSGSALDADVVSIELYKDVDGNGVLSGPDVQLGSTLASFGGGTMSFSGDDEFPVTVPAGGNVKFILVFDMAGGATLGRTLIEKLNANADVTATGVSSGQPASKIGAPVPGGTLTVNQVSSLTLAAGASNPGDSYVQDNEQDVSMIQVKLTAGASGAVDVTSIRFKASGTGNDNTDISNPILLARDNGDGVYNAGDDPTIDTVAPPANDGYFTFNFAAERINASSSVNWIVVYDLNGAASGNETFKVSLLNNSDVTVTDVNTGGPLTPSGAPVSGGLKTIASVTAITWNGSVNADFNLPGNYNEAVGPGPSIDVTVPNVGTKPIVSANGDAKVLTVAANSSVKVEPGKLLTCYGNVTVSGTMELQGNSTLRLGADTTFSTGTGSTFKVAGTSQLAGGYATVEASSGTYAMTLAGNVDLRFARFYDLNSGGLTLSASSTTTVFDNVLFYDGAAGATPYLRVTGAAWNGHNFYGMGFSDVGGTKTRAVEITTGGTVTLSQYGSGAGWLSGDATDMETSGTITWAPTAAEGLEARVQRTARGTLVTWSAAGERGTAGYRVLRRRVERHGGLIEEEAGGAAPRGERFEKFTGAWREVDRVPVRAPGGEPGGQCYRHRDKAPPGTYEYLIEEIEACGRRGKVAPARREGESQ